MKNLAIFGLMALFCTSVEAQTTKVTILAQSQCCPAMSPKPTIDKKTKKTSVVWPSTENSWIKDTCWVKAPICNNFDSIFPNAPVAPGIVPLYWLLTEENDETVLHCYFKMPADEVTGLWLASEETAIVDLQTGTQYRAKRTEPECWRKHIGVKAKENDYLDFKIFFGKIPVTTKRIAIYGVPMWRMRGEKVLINALRDTKVVSSIYDTVPEIKTPTFIKKGAKYDKDNHETWSVFDNPHLIKPTYEGTMALWNTPEATYIAVAHEQNWMREYYGLSSETMLMDNRGHRYKLKELRGLPTEQQFWIEGYSGDFIAFLMVFEPLPPSLTTFTYIEPEVENFDMWGADPEGQIINNINVQELRKNQHLFAPIERIIKE